MSEKFLNNWIRLKTDNESKLLYQIYVTWYESKSCKTISKHLNLHVINTWHFNKGCTLLRPTITFKMCTWMSMNLLFSSSILSDGTIMFPKSSRFWKDWKVFNCCGISSKQICKDRKTLTHMYRSLALSLSEWNRDRSVRMSEFWGGLSLPFTAKCFEHISLHTVDRS